MSNPPFGVKLLEKEDRSTFNCGRCYVEFIFAKASPSRDETAGLRVALLLFIKKLKRLLVFIRYPLAKFLSMNLTTNGRANCPNIEQYQLF